MIWILFDASFTSFYQNVLVWLVAHDFVIGRGLFGSQAIKVVVVVMFSNLQKLARRRLDGGGPHVDFHCN